MNRLELLIPPVGVGLLTAAAAWGMAQWTLVAWSVAPWLMALAGVLIVAGFGVALAGVVSFRNAQTTVDPFNPSKASSLVTSGVYRFTRNPMYLGMLLVLLGWAVYLGGLPPLLVTLLFIPYMTRWQIVPEERAMRTLFGDEFDRYADRVRRWV